MALLQYTVIDPLKPKLVATYTAIQKQVPGAEVVAVTYPNIFQPMTTCPGINNITVNDCPYGGVDRNKVQVGPGRIHHNGGEWDV